jgi:hypothetical protein
MPPSRHSIAWLKEEPFGVEHADVSLSANRLAATGVAIGSAPAPYRLDYRLLTRRGFVTSRLRVSTRGDGWRRELDLRRSPAGIWSATTLSEGLGAHAPPAVDLDSLDGALDCDLGLSPITNTMPVLRHGLLRAGAASCRVAWVFVPDLRVEAVDQRYSYLRTEADETRIVRFEDENGFTTEITFDADGFVVFYPELARRLEAAP